MDTLPWVTRIQTALDRHFVGREDVFVGVDLPWFPIQGDERTFATPGVLVALGRPKGPRDSYRQWEEGGEAPHVVFEVQSRRVSLVELLRKYQFYTTHGLEELYVYAPDHGHLDGYRRERTGLREIPEVEGWVSPRLGVQFHLAEGTLELTTPTQPIAAYSDLAAYAEQQWRRAERLAAKLRELGVDPDA
jgi:Uma2 family endonuclease